MTLSDIQKSELAHEFKVAHHDKFEVIPLGFDLSRFTENKEEKGKAFREQYNVADDEIVISIVGRLVPIKNHTMFLKALKIVSEKTTKKIRAFIIGDGEERQNVEKMATDLGLKFNNKDPQERNILTFTSWIKDVDVSNAGSDIIVLTSFNEGTPVSLIEAQASGKPIVSTRVGGIANIVKEGETALLCQSDDVDGFAGHLLALIENDQMRHEMSDRGTAHVMEHFSHIRLARDMSGLYRRLLNQKK